MRHRNELPLSAATFANKSDRPLVIVFLIMLLTTIGISAVPARAAMDLADTPMMSKIQPAPANIMILLDDSGSMTFEILAAGYYDGRFPNPAQDEENGYCYIFDYLGDNAYQDALRYMGTEGRKYWKSQYFRENVMYYNPATTYEPWPGYPGQDFEDASTTMPLPHPLKANVTPLNLDATSFSVNLSGGGTLNVKHAHYFVRADNDDVYLVVLDGGATPIDYYKVTAITGSEMLEKITEVELDGNPPTEVRAPRAYADERQNFANWFTYGRRREYVAKSALAQVIKSLNGVRVGILGINGKIIVPLKSVGVWKNGNYLDETGALLGKLYAYDSNGGTPLREGLKDVGTYLKDNSIWLKNYKGDKVKGDLLPYSPEEDGGACQQSFTIVMTDGYYSRDITNLGVGNADANTGNIYDGGFYADSLSETLADVAMYYYKNDLIPTLPNKVYDPERVSNNVLDTAPHQHMVTYGVAFGVSGNLNPDDYNQDPASPDFMKCINSADCTLDAYPNWPSSISIRSKETIDDLFHATVNGRGDFLTAKDPQELADALTALISNILSRLGSSASVSINGDALYGQIHDKVLIFQGSYQPTDWTGDVKAYGVDTITGRISDVPKWSAAASLDATPWADRKIFSYDGGSGIVFQESALTADQQAILGPNYADVVQYVKGDRAKEIAGVFRSRASLLGDIVHSAPVFEEDVVYVGANDGMLHAFKIQVDLNGAVSGTELFGYVPFLVYENLAGLTNPAFSHKFFVDLTPTVITGAGLLGGVDPGTILVGGLGKGGKGYFALDITDLENIDDSMVLWEFPNDSTDPDDKNDMGYSFSRPVVVKTNSSVAGEEWVVLFGNGYDSDGDNAALFILNPLSGSVIRKLVADNPDIGLDNGLSSLTAVDVNYDKKVDFVYAGDLYGNMWKFDLTGDSSAKWAVAYNDGSSDRPFFQAKGPGGTLQPITSKPEVMFHPEKHGLMVLFGTGKFLGDIDFTDDRVQTVYGVWDYGDRALFKGAWGDFSNDDDRESLGFFKRPGLFYQPDTVSLVEQTSTDYDGIVYDLDNNPVSVTIRTLSTNKPVWKTIFDTDSPGPNGEPNLDDLSDQVANNAGWYWDLPKTGERVIRDVLLRDGRLIVICFTPNPDPCSGGGSSFLMEPNASTGGNVGGTLFDLSNDRLINEKDLVIVGYDQAGNPIKVAPAGIQMPGNLEPPAILKLNDQIEIKYLSSSTGEVHIVREKAVRLGVTYWQEMQRD